MGYCLTKQEQDKFTEAIAAGRIRPDKLMDMSSAERHELFTEIVGKDNAKAVNSLLESKLLLKNQQAGMVTWAESVLGMRPRAKRDLISRIEKLDKVLDPAEEKAFLADLAETRLGVGVSFEEAKAITDLANKVKETREGMASGGERMDYGHAVVELNNYVADLKKDATKLTLKDVARNPVRMAGRVATEVAGNMKAIQASMDNSAIFRQGWKAMWMHPNIWRKNALKSFQHLVTLHGQDRIMNEIHADIVSRPTYPLMQKAKLDVAGLEEAFPTTLPEKIPVLGRFYKASENAFTAFVQKTRADVFDKYIDVANKTGVDLNDAQLQSIGKMVNSQTGRGHLGKLEPAGKVINNVFFSPKFLKSHIDTLLFPITGAGGSNFVRKESAKALIKIIGGQAVIMTIANAVSPGSVELDSRSSDFGKIRAGNTRFDISGGMGSLLTLAARLATSESKSATTGKLTDLNNPGFGEQSKLDVFENFWQNKLSPAGQVVKDWLKGEDFEHNKFSLGRELVQSVTPLPAKNATEVFQDPTASNVLKVVAILADWSGIATNTYGKKDYLQDPNVSPEVLSERIKTAKIPDLLASIKTQREMGKDTSELDEALTDKLDRKEAKGTLTQTEATKANEILGTSYEGQVEDPDAPDLTGKYGKNADGLIEKVSTWADAIGTDPADAFSKLVGGEYIARMENGTVIVKRMPESASAATRAKLGGGGKSVKLDHVIPLQIGGSNDPQNLRLVTTEEWERYTPMENYLGQALHAKKITGAKAQDLIRQFKNGWIGEDDVVKQVGEPFEPKSAPVLPSIPFKRPVPPVFARPRRLADLVYGNQNLTSDSELEYIFDSPFQEHVEATDKSLPNDPILMRLIERYDDSMGAGPSGIVPGLSADKIKKQIIRRAQQLGPNINRQQRTALEFIVPSVKSNKWAGAPQSSNVIDLRDPQ